MLILMLILIYKELLKINMTKHNRIIDKENSQYREKNVKVAKKMFPKETTSQTTREVEIKVTYTNDVILATIKTSRLPVKVKSGRSFCTTLVRLVKRGWKGLDNLATSVKSKVCISLKKGVCISYDPMNTV